MCRAGYIANVSTNPFFCQGCLPGTYSTSYNSSACTGCQAGKYGTSSVANASSWGCTDCPAGLFSTGGQTSCQACGAGSYAPIGTTTCVQCMTGTWANASASSCTACVAGKYSTSPASSSSDVCTPCASGTYSTTIGAKNSTDCRVCPAGGSSQPGAVSCSSCPANTFADAFSGLDKCTPCPANSVAGNGSTANDCLCSAGLYAFYRTKAMGGVESFTVSPNGATTYKTHTFNGPGSLLVLADVQVILQCGSSTFFLSTTYRPGTYSVPSDFSSAAAPGLCLAQSAISYKVNGAFSPSESTSYFRCSPCQPGQYKSISGQQACTDCASGTYQDAVGATTCSSCPPGAVSLAGQATCQSCSAGTYYLGNNTCIACSAGKYNPDQGGSSCQTCGAGFWSGAGYSACKTCPDFTWSSGGTDFLGCLAQPGLYMDTTFVEPVCGLCFEGTYSTGGTTSCTSCLPGTYQNLPQSSSCMACNPGWISQAPGSTQCTQCPYGYATASGQAVCVECPLTYYCPPTGGVLQCPPGTHVNRTGLGSLDECLPCPADYVCTDFAIAQPCPPNTHSPPGSTSMTACTCEFGFSCSYTKAVETSIYLPMTAAQFAERQAEFIKAVAAAAGVSPDKVSIEAIIPFTKPPASRRSLGRQNGPIIRVVAVVKGMWSLRDLEDELSDRGLPMPVSRPVMKRHHIVNIQEKRLVRR